MSWVNQYVGLPYADQGRDRTGCDCWGLVRLVYAEQLGIHLLSYTSEYASADEVAEVGSLINRDAVGGPWSLTATPKMFDVLVFRRGLVASHVGIRLNRNKMLHIAAGEQAKVQDYTSSIWGKRYLGAYRHRARPINASCLLKVGS